MLFPTECRMNYQGFVLMKKLLSAMAIMATVLLSAVSQTAAAAQWEYLGERAAGRQVDKDVIHVNSNRVYNKLQFRVRGADVNFKRMVVRYKNGVSREVAVRYLVPRGGQSRDIDLPGIGRAIDTVTFWYETKGSGRAQATVRLWGLGL